MRPTVDEQLRETRRILADTLAPLIDDGYARQILDLALANLAMLETAWMQVLPFLDWDNDAALALVHAVRGDVPDELGKAIDEAQREPAGDRLDPAAMNARNDRLNALVARAAGACGGEGRRLIQAHLLARTARYPLRPPMGRSSRPGAAKVE